MKTIATLLAALRPQLARLESEAGSTGRPDLAAAARVLLGSPEKPTTNLTQLCLNAKGSAPRRDPVNPLPKRKIERLPNGAVRDANGCFFEGLSAKALIAIEDDAA